ncbi:hypothetical protein HMI54_000923 [Coelomomyces lativittatus]|nr:hypothetical protein HMI54_000923 [Coelomomyces lativittatus]
MPGINAEFKTIPGHSLNLKNAKTKKKKTRTSTMLVKHCKICKFNVPCSIANKQSPSVPKQKSSSLLMITPNDLKSTPLSQPKQQAFPKSVNSLSLPHSALSSSTSRLPTKPTDSTDLTHSKRKTPPFDHSTKDLTSSKKMKTKSSVQVNTSVVHPHQSSRPFSPTPKYQLKKTLQHLLKSHKKRDSTRVQQQSLNLHDFLASLH